WPGNVRELEHAIGHACMMATGERIDVPDLPERIVQASKSSLGHPEAMSEMATAAYGKLNLGDAACGSKLAAQESELIARALSEAGGNQSQAARQLGIGRDALRYKLKKYSLEHQVGDWGLGN
ncbi:MAG: helix-turn-helix domain-containing protein, partial [Terriglobales bacterium]